MSAPASVHDRSRRRIALIVERVYEPDPARCVAAIVKLLTYRPACAALDAAVTDPADPPFESRQEGGASEAGAWPTQHEDRVSALQERDAAFEEDSHRDALTSADH